MNQRRQIAVAFVTVVISVASPVIAAPEVTGAQQVEQCQWPQWQKKEFVETVRARLRSTNEFVRARIQVMDRDQADAYMEGQMAEADHRNRAGRSPDPLGDMAEIRMAGCCNREVCGRSLWAVVEYERRPSKVGDEFSSSDRPPHKPPSGDSVPPFGDWFGSGSKRPRRETICARNPHSYTCLYGHGQSGGGRTQSPPRQPGRCVYRVDPARIDAMLRARPGVCARYGPDRIICQADSGQPGCRPPLQGRIGEDRVAWKNWCEEYKRLVKRIVWAPLSAEFSGPPSQWYQASLNFGFYNPRFSNPAAIKKQARRNGATVWQRPDLIFVSVKPGYQVWDSRQKERFLGSVKARVDQLARAVPPFPPQSKIAYFTRPSTITLNTASGRTKFSDCENFLDEIEGRRPPAGR